MRSVSLFALLLVLLTATVAFAKRSPPKEVAPVRHGDLELRVPHGQMGCIEAWDVGKKVLVWRRQIYAVKYDVDLERDVQDIFIKSIEIKDQVLVVKNERDSIYELDLESLEVKPTKGPLVEHTKIR